MKIKANTTSFLVQDYQHNIIKTSTTQFSKNTNNNSTKNYIKMPFIHKIQSDQ